MSLTQDLGTHRDREGWLLGPSLNFTEADTNGRVFERDEGERLSDSEARVLADLPAIAHQTAHFTAYDTIA